MKYSISGMNRKLPDKAEAISTILVKHDGSIQFQNIELPN